MVNRLLFLSLFFLTTTCLATDAGFNFRATGPFVTDGANETNDLGPAYPVTRGGYTFGWDVDISANSRDRSASVDRRLAGVAQATNGNGEHHWRLDLPATGVWTINGSHGDQANAQTEDIEYGDNGVYTTVVLGGAPGADSYVDATGTVRTDATWVSQGGGTSISKTMTSTLFNCRLANLGSVGGSSTVTHLRFQQGGGGGKFLFFIRR